MSNFRTQVNFSSQIKEYPNTDGTLSGSVNVQQYTILGTDYLDLPLGLDGSSTGITSNFFPATYGTFTGTTGSTTFFFSDPNMDLGIPYLSALTPSNSGITQNVEVYIPLTTLIVDGNSFDIYYSGVSYDLVASNMYEYTPGEFSGITFTNVLEYISGTTYPWWFLKSGSTTWNEVKGRTQTDRLTVVEGANPGYVLTSSNSDGDAVWLPVSGGSFTGGTGTCITDLYVSNIHACSPLNINPLDEGNVYFGSTSGITLDISNKRVGINTESPSYTFDFNSSDGNTNLYYLDTTPTAQSVYFSGNSGNMPQLGVTSRLSSLPLTIGVSMGIVGENSTLYPGYGNPLDSFIYAGADTNRLNIVSAPTSSVSTNSDDIRFYAGQFVNSGFGADIHIQGSGTTRGYVGIGNESPNSKLHISGDTIVNSDYLMLSDTLTTIPVSNFKGFISYFDTINSSGYNSYNTNSSGSTGFGSQNDAGVFGLIQSFGSDYIKPGFATVGPNFYQNKTVIRNGPDGTSNGLVINPNTNDSSATLWFEIDGSSAMILKGDGVGGSGNAYLGLALNPDGTEMPTSNLQIGGTGTTGTFQYIDGSQAEGKILTSDANGNVTWETNPNTFFTDDITTLGTLDGNGYRILYPFTATTNGDYIFDATTRVDLAGASPTSEITTCGVVNGTQVAPNYRTTISVGMTVTHTEKKKLTLSAGDVFHYGVITPVTAVLDGAMIVFKIS